MTTYDTLLPVHVRIGGRREWTIGAVPADQQGRVNPEKLGELFVALGEHIQVLVEKEWKKERRHRGHDD